MINDAFRGVGDSARRGDLNAVQTHLLSGGYVDTVDGYNMTALDRAVMGGHVDIVALLLEHGADVQHCARGKESVLHRACAKNNTDTVRELLKHGADVHAVKSDGDSPLHVALSNHHIDVATLLIDEGGADVNQHGQHGWTSLHVASRWGNEAAVRMLLTRGALTNVNDNEGLSPLVRAVAGWRPGSKYGQVVEHLVKCGASIPPLDYMWAKGARNTVLLAELDRLRSDRVVMLCSAAQLLPVVLGPVLTSLALEPDHYSETLTKTISAPPRKPCLLANLPMAVIMKDVIPKCRYEVGDVALEHHRDDVARRHDWGAKEPDHVNSALDEEDPLFNDGYYDELA